MANEGDGLRSRHAYDVNIKRRKNIRERLFSSPGMARLANFMKKTGSPLNTSRFYAFTIYTGVGLVGYYYFTNKKKQENGKAGLLEPEPSKIISPDVNVTPLNYSPERATQYKAVNLKESRSPVFIHQADASAPPIKIYKEQDKFEVAIKYPIVGVAYLQGKLTDCVYDDEGNMMLDEKGFPLLEETEALKFMRRQWSRFKAYWDSSS